MVSIKEVMKEVCSEANNEKICSMLEAIYDHIDEHEGETPEGQGASVRRIIDSILEESE